MTAYGIAAFIILWAITAELATAFICKLPTPWDYTKGQCHDRRVRDNGPSTRALRHADMKTLAHMVEFLRSDEHRHGFCTDIATLDYHLEHPTTPIQKSVGLLIFCL